MKLVTRPFSITLFAITSYIRKYDFYYSAPLRCYREETWFLAHNKTSWRGEWNKEDK